LATLNHGEGRVDRVPAGGLGGGLDAAEAVLTGPRDRSLSLPPNLFAEDEQLLLDARKIVVGLKICKNELIIHRPFKEYVLKLGVGGLET
jgi:hypothetical protein